MFGSTTLDIVIGLASIYLLLGLISSLVVELLSSWLTLRAQYLRKGLRTLLKDPVLVEKFCDHPMINSLIIDDKFPPYLPARAFALALLGLVGEGESNNARDLRRALYTLPPDGATGSLRVALLTMADDAGEDFDRLRSNIEFWYISTMDRVSDLYKRRVQAMVFITALLITVAANLDTGAIARYISISPFMHDLLAARTVSRAYDQRPTASSYPSPVAMYSPSPAPTGFASSTPFPSPSPRAYPINSPEPGASNSGVPSVDRYADELGLPFGWANPSQFKNPARLFTSILGWLFTALAGTICAFLWFDVLNKFILVRYAVKPRDRGTVGINPPPDGAGTS